MVARGYRGNPVKHRIYFLTKLSIKPQDWIAISGLLILTAFSMYLEITLPAWYALQHIINPVDSESSHPSSSDFYSL